MIGKLALKGFAARFFLIGLCFTILIYQLWPLFSDRTLAGWDVSGHYYLANLMLGYLKEGKISGYDPNWFCGFPAFVLYPPLSYIIMLIAHLVLPSEISVRTSFNLFVIQAALLFLISLVVSSRLVWGRKASIFSPLFALLFLSIPPIYGYLGLGLSAVLHWGFMASLLGAVLILWLPGIFVQMEVSKSWLWPLLGGLVFGLCIFTHQLSAVFCAWLIGLRLLIPGNSSRIRILLLGLFGLVLSATWWSSALPILSRGSGQSMSWPATLSDPLPYLFPGLSPDAVATFTEKISMSYAIGAAQGWSSGLQYSVPTFVLEFPYTGILFLITFIVGMVSLCRDQSWFLPVTWFLSILILPRQYLSTMLELEIHYYRLLTPIVLIQLFISIKGSRLIWEFLAERERSLSRSMLQGAAECTVLITILIATLYQFDISKLGTNEDQGLKGAGAFVDSYPWAADAQKMLTTIVDLKPVNRIAEEKIGKTLQMLGSPNYFSTELPLKANIAVAEGVLLESSMLAGFIRAALAHYSEHFRWGRKNLSENRDFYSQSIDSMMRRLAFFNIEYLVVASETYKRNLHADSVTQVESVARVGEFELFKIKNVHSRFQSIEYKPFLFVSRSQLTFREFSEWWYLDPEFMDYPIITTSKSYSELSEFDKNNIGGFIVDWPELEKFSPAKIKELISTDKPIIVLASKFSKVAWAPANVRFLRYKSRLKSARKLLTLVKQNAGGTPKHRAIVPAKEDAHSMEFSNQGPVLINFSFAPAWRSAEAGQTIFEVTPGLMLVFSQGQTRLSYDR